MQGKVLTWYRIVVGFLEFELQQLLRVSNAFRFPFEELRVYAPHTVEFGKLQLPLAMVDFFPQNC
jgi:hypothetical protein